MVAQALIDVSTRGRSIVEVTDRVAAAVADGDVVTGLCHLFLRHTSASLMVCENADPAVLRDMEAFMSRLVRDGDPLFEHSAEGPDDMPAHVRSVLTQTSLTLPVARGALALGTWQGVFVWEHRYAPHRRQLVVTISGDARPPSRG